MTELRDTLNFSVMKELEIKKILVPINYDKISGNALDLAIAISRRHGAMIRLIHIVDSLQYITISGNGLLINFSKKAILASETRRLRRFADEIMDNPIDIYSVECRTGNVSRSIVEAALEFESDLIIMGINGTSGVSSSEANEVIEAASCPVLTIPKHQSITEFKEVLFPVRPITGALEKYGFVKEIIHQDKTHLTVLGLINEEEPWQTDLFSEAVTNLEDCFLRDKIKADMVFVNTDSAAETVLNKSQHLTIDLIVITANLDDADPGFFMESYAEQIVNRAKVPVLAINPQVLALQESINFAGNLHEYLPAD
jgi:nucleotide-binding universal stress UspA family protein